MGFAARNLTYQSKRSMKKGDLQRITSVTAYNTGCANLKNRSQTLLWYLLACVRMGYSEIKVPIGALLDEVSRGKKYSESTLYRALRELENLGYISRDRFRIGENRKRVIIHLNVDAFSYWTRKKSNNVIPFSTSAHIGTPLSNCQLDKGMIIEERVNTHNNTVLFNKTHARVDNDRCQQYKKQKKTIGKHIHPILFTLRILFWNQDIAQRIPKGSPMYAIAKSEIEAPGSTDCPVDFKYWTDRWQEMSKDRREITAAQEIVPYLKNRRKIAHQSSNFKKPAAPPQKPAAPPQKPGRPATPDEIKNYLGMLKIPDITEDGAAEI